MRTNHRPFLEYVMTLGYVMTIAMVAGLGAPVPSQGDPPVSADHREAVFRAQTGTVLIRFDPTVLEALDWRVATRHESSDDESIASLTILSSSILRVDTTNESDHRMLEGIIRTRGAFLLDNAGTRVAIGNLLLQVRANTSGTVTSHMNQSGDDGLVFDLVGVTTKSPSIAGEVQFVGKLALARPTASSLGIPDAGGVVFATVAFATTVVPFDQAVVGTAESSSTPSTRSSPFAATVGPDVIVGDIPSTQRWARVGQVTAYSISTISCNIGDQPIDWFANTPRHPVISQRMYRLKGDAFEQIGMSWVKHGFEAGNGTLCSGPGRCILPATAQQLGVGCSDIYTTTFNGFQSNLGPPSDINPSTGDFPYPFTAPAFTTTVDRRLQVHDADLDPSLNAGTTYFMEAQYLTPDDAAAGNQDNNASYREVFVVESSPGTFDLIFSFAPNNSTLATQREKPAILAWQDRDPAVHISMIDVPGDGRLILGSKVTARPGGIWHYEYAIENINSDRAVQSFQVPVAAGVVLPPIGFHDVDSHSGSVYSSADWTITMSNGAITWATDPFSFDANANALRWGTLYNFRFDANTCPTSGDVTLALFKPGVPASLAVTTELPSAPLQLVSSDPPDGAIDARQPSDIAGAHCAGWDHVDFTFATLSPCVSLTPADFTVAQVGGVGSAPTITAVTSLGGPAVRVTLSDRMAPGAWTVITHQPSGTRVRLGFLPADVNGDGVSTARDITTLIDSMNGAIGLLPLWSTDINRINGVEASDITRTIDLLSGAGVYDNYYFAALPPMP